MSSRDKILIMQSIMKIVNENNLNELKRYIKINNINLQDLKEEFNSYNGYSCLKQCIENKVSIEILEYLNIQCKCNLLNNTFLSVAIDKHNFEIADYIIENGEDVNSISYGNIILRKTKRSTQYLIDNGLNVTSKLLLELIKINNFTFLNQIFRKCIYDNDFILSLLSFYKNETELSNINLNEMIQTEKEKIKFNKEMYDVALQKDYVESILLLYLYDTRGKEIINKEIISIFNQKNKLKGPILNKIKNFESKVPIKKELISVLENITTKQEIKNNISQLIKHNNINNLKLYIKQNNIKLDDFRDKFNQKDDILKFTIKNASSMEMLNFIFKSCQYDTIDFSSDKNYSKDTTLLYTVLSKNQFKFFDFLLKLGLNINNKDILTWLYEDNILDNKKLKYILNSKFQVLPNTINQLIIDNKLDLLKYIFKIYIYNDIFILKLLSIYKNHTKLSNKQLLNIIYEEKNKISFDDSMYEKAIDTNNYEAISFLYTYDNRNKDLIFKDLFQLLDKNEQIYRNGRKKLFTQNIKDKDLIPIDSYFLDNLSHSEDRFKNVINFIKNEQLLQLKEYILKNNIILPYFNNKTFDLLIYSIENDNSYNMVLFIMKHYSSLDYIIVDANDTQKYKSPLYCAIANKKHEIVKLLLDNGANLNCKIHDKEMNITLYEERLLNKSNLKLLLNHGLNISSEFMEMLIKNRRYDLLYIIFKNYIFDNTFILNILSISTRKIPLSNDQLMNIVVKEESKIDIGKNWYKDIIMNKNASVLEMFYHYRRLKREEHFVLDKDEIECLLTHAIETDNYQLIEKVFKSESFDFKEFNVENISINYRYICDHYNIVTYLFSKTFSEEQYDIKKVKFYEKMGIIDLSIPSMFEFFKFYINIWFNHKNFSLKDFDLEKILESLNVSIEITYENKAIELMKYFIDIALKNETFDFNNISFENILNVMVNQISSYQMEYGSKIEHIVLIKLIIEQCINHKTFDCKLIDFEDVISILNQLQNTYSDFNDDVFSDLIRFTIEKIVQHKTFDCNYVNIKKIIFLLVLQRDYISTIEFLLKEIFNCHSFTLKNINAIEDIILTVSKIENEELVQFVIDSLIQHPTFIEENISTQKFLSTVIKIKNFQIFQYVIEEYFKQTFKVFDTNAIENIFLIISKIKNSFYIDFMIDQIVHHENVDMEYINNKSINIDKILKYSIKNNNIYFMEYIFNNLLDDEYIKTVQFENLLLYANKIDNITVLKFLLEKLFNVKTLQINNLDLKSIDNTYIILILNILIKLYNKKLVQHIIENNYININSSDKNGDYPLITSFYSLNGDNDNQALEIFDYLLDKGANVNINDINNTPLLILALKNKKYIILQHLLKKDVSIDMKTENKTPSLLLTAVEQNNINEVKSIINNNYNDLNNECSEYCFTPLTLSYLLHHQEIFKFLLNTSCIHSLDYYGYNILHYFMFKEDKTLVEELVSKGVEINLTKNKYLKGHSAVEISIYLKNHELLLLLLKNEKISINKVERDKNPLLILIMMMKNYSMEEKLEWMEDLIKNGADVNAYDKKGQSIFMIAFKENALPIIKLLVEYSANINNPMDKNNKKVSIIRYAIENEDISIIECLIKYDKRNSLTDEDIEIIINNDRLDIIQKLIPQYIDINRKDEYGFSLLCRTVFSDNIRIAKYLIENGIDTHNSENKIIEQIIYKTSLPMLKLLIPNYIDVNSKFNSANNDIPQSLLNCAIDIQNEPLIHYLIRCNVDFHDVSNKTGFLDNLFNSNQMSNEIYQDIIKNSSLNEILTEIVDKERMDLLKILIDHHLDINRQYKDGKTLLLYAIEKRNTKLIECLINNNVDIHSLKCNFIKNIIMNGKLDILKFLLSNNIKILFKHDYLNLIYTIENSTENVEILNIINIFGTVNVSVVGDRIDIKDFILKKNSLDLLKELVPEIIDIHIQDINKCIPLIYAVEAENKEIIDYLIKCGSHWKEIENIKIDIKLFKNFINLQLPDIFTIFNNNSLEIHQKDENNNSMLIYSILQNRGDVVKYLIDKGVDINEQNKGDIPLTIAIKNRKVDILTILIDNGADKSFISNSNESLFDINERYNNNGKHQKEFIQIKDILNNSIKNSNNLSSIKLAIISDNKPIVKELLEKDPSNIKIINNNIKIVETLINKNNLDLVKYLVEHQLDVNMKDGQGFTPLMYAVIAENEVIIKYLMDNGSKINLINSINIDPKLFKSILKMDKSRNLQQYHLLNIIYQNSIKGNQNDKDYDPIICYAILHGEESLVQYLIDQGADVNSYSRNYKCPFILAIKNNQENIVKCLIKNGVKLNNYKEDPPLVEAIRANNENIIKYLIECGANINERSRHVGSDTSLTVAIKKNNEKLVKYLIEYGVDINIETSLGESALIHAVRNQNMNIIQYLIESGADVNLRLSFNSPLLEAIEGGNEKIIKYLVDIGADVNVTNRDGKSPLDLAIKNNMERIINYLIYNGAKIDDNSLIEAAKVNNLNIIKHLVDNGADVKINNTPLTIAIQNRNEAMVRYLIYCGVDINKSEGLSPLITAINNNDEIFVKLLIQCGADVNMDGGRYFDNIPLAFAVKNNNENLSMYLVQCGADVNKCRQFDDTPLIYAIQNENENLIRFLVDSGANIDKEGKDGDPLKNAIKKNNEHIVSFLVEHGAEINKGEALLCAIDNGNENIIRYLIEQGANINLNSYNNGTPLSHAVQNGQIELVKYLIEKGANVNQVTSNGEKTAISFAAICGNENMVKCLVENGSYINGERCKYTPLYYAIKHRNINVIAFLLDCGVDINLVKGGKTHLITAIKTNNEKIIKYLIDHGANVNQCDINDNTPLSCAINLSEYSHSYGSDEDSDNNYESVISFERKKERIIQYLVEHGADINKKSGNGAPIMEAVDKGNIKIINYLIKKGVDINKRIEDNEGLPLIRAIKVKNENVVKFLISCGANVNQKLGNGETPLIYAIKNPINSNKNSYVFSYFNEQEDEEQQKNIWKKENIIKILIENGADVNCEDNHGYNPLMHIIKAENDNNLKIINYLVEHGADINKADKHGNNALSLAMNNNNDILVKYLLDLGATF